MTGRILLVVWLALVWVLLWGSAKPLVLVSAVVVAPLCAAAARLPTLPMAARPRPWLLPGALGRFAVDLALSSAQVAWATVRRGPDIRSAVIAVPVRSSSDVVLTVVANRLSLVPGTLVLNIDRDAEELYLYVFDVRGAADLERARRDARRSTADVLRVFGQGTTEGPRDGKGEHR